MIRDITIGQYYPTKSILHQLDPRVKLIATVMYAVSLFFLNSLIGYLTAALFFGVVVILSNIPFRYIVRGMKPMVVLLIVTITFNLFLTKGDVLFKIWFLRLTREGIYSAFLTAYRFIFLILGTSMMTFTTTSNELTDGMEKLFAPLNKLHIKVHELAMMMSIALRFIPILIEETNKIMKAQIARGADFETGNLIQKAKNMIPLLVPLLVSAFRRAGELAEAMEARGYRGGEGRTKMKPLRYTRTDAYAYIFLGIYVGLIILQRIVF